MPKGIQYFASLFYIPLSVIFTFRNDHAGMRIWISAYDGWCGKSLLQRLICALISMKIMSYSLAVFCDPAAWLAAGIFTMFAYLHGDKTDRKEMQKNRTN